MTFEYYGFHILWMYQDAHVFRQQLGLESPAIEAPAEQVEQIEPVEEVGWGGSVTWGFSVILRYFYGFCYGI